MASQRNCVVCGDPLNDGHPARDNQVTCGRNCRKALSRARKNGTLPGTSVTTDSLERYIMPDRSRERASEGDERFYQEFALYEQGEAPKSQRQIELEALQKRNQGPVLPELAEIYRAQADERERLEAEAAARAYEDAYVPEDPLNPTTKGKGDIGKRGQAARQANRRAAGIKRATGFGPAGAPVIEPINRNTPRWMMPGNN
jgi:hypothetical protein